ncbi:MAG: VOC family protein [Bacteroidetes bacterium]|nr:VOC family protein [Bacteroidota bacterium]
MSKYICGIQQIGLGVSDINKSWDWYSKKLKINVPVFEEAAQAALMTKYTGGNVHLRHAILAISMGGGGGFEIWQYTSRTPQPAEFEILPGDIGFLFPKIRCRDIYKTFDEFNKTGIEVCGKIIENIGTHKYFFIKDNCGNVLQIIENNSWMTESDDLTGGICGVAIGVSNIENSLKLYKNILGYDTVKYDTQGKSLDMQSIGGGDYNYRRVLLKHSTKRSGAFSHLLRETEIELIEVQNRTPRKIFENRYWGDLGYIHLCFDVSDMSKLKEELEKNGFNFTVDSSSSFDMGEAAGHFTYIEDPDGNLIEFVETHKIPVLKKIGFYINLQKRNKFKPLPKWMLKLLKYNKRKN